MQAPISSEMEYPSDKKDNKAVRLGSLRYGEKAPVIPEPHKKANCPEGWYELLAGGFVCGKYATLDLDHPRFKLVKAPDLGGPAALHVRRQRRRTARRSTGRCRRARSGIKLEPWLAQPRKAKTDDDNPYATTSATAAATPDAARRRQRPAGRRRRRGRQRQALVAEGRARRRPPRRDARGPAGERRPHRAAHGQGLLPLARPPVRLGRRDVVEDHGGLVAPADRIFVSKPVTEFHGVWLGTGRRRPSPRRTIPRAASTSCRSASCSTGARTSGRSTQARKHATQAEGEHRSLPGRRA